MKQPKKTRPIFKTQLSLEIDQETKQEKPKKPIARQGWGQAGQKIASAGKDNLVLGDFANADDGKHSW